MKRLQSTVGALKEIFNHSITAKDIAEPLVSFDFDKPAATVKAFMERARFDIVGIRREGTVAGYVQRTKLFDGNAGNYMVDFEQENVMPAREPLLNVLKVVSSKERAFMAILGQIGGIITLSDLEKIPVRMWCFGLVSLLEMQMLRIIRLHYPNDKWVSFLSSKRISDAKIIHADRVRRNSEIDLADCLQFCDKRDIFIKSDELYPLIKRKDRKSDYRLLTELKRLRDAIAHAQRFRSHKWPILLDRVEATVGMIKNLEAY